MKFLRELLDIVVSNAPKSVETQIDYGEEGKRDMPSKLAYGIGSGRYSSDAEAAADLYGDPALTLGYRSAKTTLRRRLINTLFLLDTSVRSESGERKYRNDRQVFVARTLMMVGARNNAIRIASKGLKEAEEIEYTPNSLEFSTILRANAALTGDLKSFNRYNGLVKKYMETYRDELVTNELFIRARFDFVLQSHERPELFKQASEFLQTVEVIRKGDTSLSIEMNYYRLAVLASQISQNYKLTIRLCEEAQIFLKSKSKIVSPSRLGEFALDKLESALFLRDFESGKTSASECAQLIGKGKYNWFLYMEVHFLLAMHSRHFDSALEIYNEAIKHPGFILMSAHRAEKWKMFSWFLWYALDVPPPVNRMTDQKLRRGSKEQRQRAELRSFLKEVPSYTKDKRGYNIGILIVHILYLLKRHDFDAIINRMEALKTYQWRYLRGRTNRQSALFFKLLQVMVASNFDYETTKQKGKKYHDQIIASTAGHSEFSEGLQVLPFDWLWEQVLEQLLTKAS